jgi:TBC1 domain family member 2
VRLLCYGCVCFFVQCLEKVLYVWAIRHPASGYVQGINDLATPFMTVFLQHLTGARSVASIVPSEVSAEVLSMVEADTFWCLSKLLDGIQDHYTFAQPGIQRMVYRLKELVHRIDAPLHDHLTEQKLDFNMFAYRWSNCMLMRELELPLVVRVWDTYFAEDGDGFSALHVYVCAALLIKFADKLKKMVRPPSRLLGRSLLCCCAVC